MPKFSKLFYLSLDFDGFFFHLIPCEKSIKSYSKHFFVSFTVFFKKRGSKGPKMSFSSLFLLTVFFFIVDRKNITNSVAIMKLQLLLMQSLYVLIKKNHSGEYSICFNSIHYALLVFIMLNKHSLCLTSIHYALLVLIMLY